MKKLYQFISSTGLLFLLLISINTYPAYLTKVPKTFIQPDGTELHCFVTGDEFHHWVHDAEGYTITINSESGYYVYADKENGDIIATNLIPGIHSPEDYGLTPGIQPDPEIIYAKRKEFRASLDSIRSLRGTGMPNKGPVDNIVIFIRFADQDEFDETTEYYLNKYNGIGQVNTLQNYYHQVSGGQLSIESHLFPTSSPYVASYQDIHPRSYYCKYNEFTNPNGYQNEGQATSREHKLLERACEYVDADVTYSGINFDRDGNLLVDNVDFIIQGESDSWGDILWPHHWALSTEWAFFGNWFDMRMVWDYSLYLSDELETGVMGHETFHSIGAPDLYHDPKNGYAGLHPVGYWDIMDHDANGAQQMSTYMKKKYGKWIDEIPEITESGTYTLEPLSTNPFASYKIQSPFSPNEFFVLEYRKQEGLFESNIPWYYDEGLIVYRINPRYNGNFSATPGKDEVYVYRPNGTLYEDGQLHMSAFSVTNGRTDFNDFTNPSCFLSNGNYGGLDISNVSEIGDEISFVVWGNNVNPPHDLQAVVYGTNVNLFWTAPVLYNRELVGYNIYRNETKIAGPITEVEFTNYNVPYGSHHYKVTAQYTDGESLPTNMVDISISSTTYSMPFIEEFTGNSLPFAWQNIDPNANTQLWQFNNPGNRNIWGANFDEDFAILDSDMYGSGSEQKSYLVTPPIDCENSSAIELIFDQSFKSYPQSYSTIDISDDGVNWNTVYYNATDIGYPNPAVKTNIDISGYAAYKPKVWVRFTYTGDWGWWWAIDNVVVRDMDEVLDPACELEAQVVEDDVHLSWYPPEYCNPQGEWINWDDGINDHGIGLLTGGDWFASSRWDDLTAYDGWYISKVAIFPRTDANTGFTLKVWKGENAGMEYYSEELTNIVQYEWNQIILDDAVQINADDELWVGYKITGQPYGDFPAGCDAGPAVVGYGDKISQDGVNWLNASDLNMDHNWNIQVYLTQSSEKREATAVLNMGSQPENSGSKPELESQKSPVGEALTFVRDSDPIGFNIYRNYSLIATVDDIMYTDSALLPQNYVYTVKALYAEGEAEMTTPAEVWVEYFEHHFTPSNSPPFNDMIFTIYSAQHDLEDLEFGDEIGLYDIDPNTGAEICIGTRALLENNTKTLDSIQMVIPMNSNPPGDTINGFVEGHDFLFKFYLRNTGFIEPVEATAHFPGMGTMNYQANGMAYLDLASVDTAYTVMEIQLEKGWQGLSSNIIPLNPSLNAVFSGIESDIIALADLEEIIYNSQRAGEAWEEEKGYFIKVENDCKLSIIGNKTTENTLPLHIGWNLIPVFSDCEIPSDEFYIQGVFEIVKEVAGTGVYWPIKQINTLDAMQPGKAYLIYMYSDGTIYFPECDE
jgi:M6 family metalloprotease-like protein